VGLVLVGSGVAIVQTGLTALRQLDPLPRTALSTLSPTVFEQKETV